MFNIKVVTTKVKKEMMDAVWKWGVLWTLLTLVITTDQLLTAITVGCSVALVINLYIIIRPLSYNIDWSQVDIYDLTDPIGSAT